MGLLNSNHGQGNWADNAIGGGSAMLGVPTSPGNGLMSSLMRAMQASQGGQSQGGWSASPPGTMWWDQPGAGTMGVTKAPPLNRPGGISSFLGGY
jgi:hypothetical protein